MRKFALIAATIAGAGVARADSVISEYGPGLPLRAAVDLTETQCELDLVVTGGIATGELRERIANGGAAARAATLDLDLPRGAVVTGFALGGDTGMRVPVGARADTVDTDVMDADPGVLARAADGTYRATLAPISPQQDVALGVRFVVRPEIAGGALRLVLPPHDAIGGRPACRAIVRATGGPGAAVEHIRVDGREVGARGSAAFAIDDKPVALEIALAIAGSAPVAWSQSEDLGEGWRAELTTVIAPVAPAATANRVLFVVDSSRSMQLVGRDTAAVVAHAIAAVLPATTTYEGVLFDRTAARAVGAWGPAEAVERAIAARPAANGTDLAAAFALAKTAIGGERATVVVITDGLIPELHRTELVDALGGDRAKIDVHVVLLDPSGMHAEGAAQLARPVEAFGGSIVEVDAGAVTDAIAAGRASAWLRPAWTGIAGVGEGAPDELVAGDGFATLAITKAPRGRTVLTARMTGAAGAKVPAQALGAATTGLAQLALVTATNAREDGKMRERFERAHPLVSTDRMLAVLAARGKVAQSRRAMVAGGGPFTRMIALEDPAPSRAAEIAASAVVVARTSAIADIALRRMLRETLEPRAFVCYEGALGTAPALAGTATFAISMARGEVTHAEVTGLGDAAFDACLAAAAYAIEPAFPDFDRNVDDETRVNYALAFKLADHKPSVEMPHSGDADAPDRLDIDKIEGGVPGRRTPVKVDTSTPLGKLRP